MSDDLNMTRGADPDDTLHVDLDELVEWTEGRFPRAKLMRAYYIAGHVVAAVARGGKLIEVRLADESDDTPEIIRYINDFADDPFVTFAGSCAEAMWSFDNDGPVADIQDVVRLHLANHGGDGGDLEKYEKRVEALRRMASALGFGRVGRAWEGGWIDEMVDLWDAVREVATMLLIGQTVTHRRVKSAMYRVTGDCPIASPGLRAAADRAAGSDAW